MVSQRTVEDHLRAEYARLLPVMRRVLIAIETEIRHTLLPASLSLLAHERIVIRTRIKECESAVEALKRRQPFGEFRSDLPPEHFSLTTLPDLVGIRVLTFPRRRLEEVRQTLSSRLAGWRADPVYGGGPDEQPIALKYNGRWETAHPFSCEVQIASLLVGLFWEVEHGAIYKPSPDLQGLTKRISMREKTRAVEDALNAFELEFERLIESADHSFDPEGE